MNPNAIMYIDTLTKIKWHSEAYNNEKYPPNAVFFLPVCMKPYKVSMKDTDLKDHKHQITVTYRVNGMWDSSNWL